MPRPLAILMIEDSHDDFTLLATACQVLNQPYAIDHRATGEAGIDALMTAKAAGTIPDIVLIDVGLPGLPGDEVLAAIRADPELRTMTVIMLTGSDARQDQDACAAADQYIVKPQTLSGWRSLARCLCTIARHGGHRAGTGAEPGTETRAEVGTSRLARQARECHLLHIDDDADDRELFALAFAKSGLDGVLHSVDGAADALLYLNQLGPHIGAPRPRLIILDLSLPRLDGRELLELLRVNPRFKGIPVIVLTGSEDYADMARCRALGVDDYVVKPHTSQELVELIASFDHWLVGSETGSPLR